VWPLEYLPYALLVVSGGIVVTLAAPFRSARGSAWWLPFVGATALVSAVSNFLVYIREPSALYRDAFGAATLAAISAGITGTILRNPENRLSIALIFLLICAVASPFVVLVAHCTSGDCL
jgi:hypothetical protein